MMINYKILCNSMGASYSLGLGSPHLSNYTLAFIYDQGRRFGCTIILNAPLGMVWTH